MVLVGLCNYVNYVVWFGSTRCSNVFHTFPFSHDILEVYSPDEEFYPTDMPGEVEQVEVNQGIPRRNQM